MPEASPLFLTTRWSVVLAAREADSPRGAAALETLCRAYWLPLYGFARRRGNSPHDAQDLTQEFFARLLAKEWLAALEPSRGRFRTFLLVAFQRFLANEWRDAAAVKRGGGHAPLPLDGAHAEARFATDAAQAASAEAAFDRLWALTLLDGAVSQVEAEFGALGKAEEFRALRGCLVAERGATDYAVLAAALGASEGAARVAVHRLRKRFRAVLRAHLAETVSSEAEVDAELRHLAAALAGG